MPIHKFLGYALNFEGGGTFNIDAKAEQTTFMQNETTAVWRQIPNLRNYKIARNHSGGKKLYLIKYTSKV